MNQRYFPLSFLVFIFSILTILIEFFLPKLTHSFVTSFILSSLILIVLCYILLEKALNYKGCFLLSLLLIIITTVLCIFMYQTKSNTLLPYHNSYWYLIPINWFTPMLYCLIRNLLDRGPKFLSFKRFFLNMSVVFGICYTTLFIYLLLINPSVGMQNMDENYNFIPFLTLATYIESYIYDHNTASQMAVYILPAVFLYLPFGFYIKLFCKRLKFLPCTLIMACLPLFVEILQLILHLGNSDIDDILLALIGCALGSLVSFLLNELYLFVKDEDFLYERSGYHFSRRF